MAGTTTPADVLAWVQVTLQLVTIGATSIARIKAAAIDAGWAKDDARLVALSAEYAKRSAVRRAEA